MTPRSTTGIVGVILGLILIFILPAWMFWVGALIVVAALAVPVVGYLALDKSQRRRVRAIRARRKGY